MTIPVMQCEEVTTAVHSAEDDARKLANSFQSVDIEAAVCKSWLEHLQQQQQQQQQQTSSSVIGFFQGKVRSTESSLSNVTADLAVTEMKLQSFLERMEVEADGYKDEPSESVLQEEKGRLQEELKSVDREIADIKSEADKRVQGIKEAEDKLDELRASAEEAANRVKAVEGKICSLRAIEKQLQKELHLLVILLCQLALYGCNVRV